MSFTEEYRGCLINYREFSNDWRVQIGESYSDHKTPDLCRKKVDSVMKKDFKRFDVIVKEWNDYCIVTVTSIDIEGDFWVLMDGHRRKCDKEDVFILDELSIKCFNTLRSEIIKCNEIITNAEKRKAISITEFEKTLKLCTNKAQS